MTMNHGIWKVESVDLTTHGRTSRWSQYPFCVQGRIVDGAERIDDEFSWQVPNVSNSGYDLSRAIWTDEARAYAESAWNR